MRKRWLWGIVGLAAILVFVLAKKWATGSATAAAGHAPRPVAGSNTPGAAIELAAGDWSLAEARDLNAGVPVSGALKAVYSAVLKARVAGELQAFQVREGDFVSAQQVLARIDPTEYQARLKQAKEQSDSAKAQVDIAQRQYDNNKALVEQGFISKTSLDTAWNTLLSARATHQAALAAMDVAQKALDDTVLRSPIAGQVSQRLMQNGERAAVDAKVLEVIDTSRLEMEAPLSPDDAAQLRLGQSASLQIEGFRPSVSARVVRINPALVAGSRAVLVYLAVDKSTGLRQGLFAQGVLHTGTLHSVAVPEQAVRTDKPEPYVQVIEGDAPDRLRVRHWRVEPGLRVEQANQVWLAVKGLPEGTRVIAGALGPLREGSGVRMPPPAPAAAASSAAAATAPAR